MGSLVWFTLLGFLTINSCAGRPHPCKSPPLLQGSLSMIGQSEDFQAIAKFNYDALEQRIHFGEFGYYQNKTFHVDALLLYKEGVMYKINRHNKTCTRKELKSSFHPLKVPHNATLLGQVVLGSMSHHGESLLVNSWAGEIPEHKAKYLLTFTKLGCIPVSCLYNSPKTGGITISFFNNIVGIVDPNVFIPPPYCTTATLEEGSNDFFSIF
ncbi:hypothetical protein P4O66_012679 [Electrophorus voltai]|uniref:Ependymin-like 1 n=1 Tax=Electrophorus voltai TaxID=2609070 RepID=A0AAD8Z7E8_9TELE|nr:ependymin-like 1 [Electrophorus electricus]KAK1792758.1 hypothetical protein P4O66_012679 [Electrophorus voltai]